MRQRTKHRRKALLLAALLVCTPVLAVADADPADARPRCDRPVFGDPLPVDVDLPHDLATGRGVGVAVVDTGAASPGVITERDGDADHCLLHGTAVAGVLRAVAPGARVVSVRQGDGETETTVADLVAALDRVREDPGEIRVVNISVVACEDTPELRESVAAAEAAGLLLVAAAGNAGQCQDGQLPYPAALPGVLTVGGVDVRRDDDPDAGRRPADYSVPGSWVDLHAPGGPVSAPLETSAETDTLVRTVVGDPAPFTGTSFAAPVVSATAALVWQLRPELSAARVRELVVASADHGVVPVVSPAAAVSAALDGRDVHHPDRPEHPGTYPVAGAVTVPDDAPTPRDLRIPVALGLGVILALLGTAVVRLR